MNTKCFTLTAGILFGLAFPTAQAGNGGPVLHADIGPEGCDISYTTDADPGSHVYDEEDPANVNVVQNQRWIIGECHVKLNRDQLEEMGGPFKRAQHYWYQDEENALECEVDACEVGACDDDVPAFAAHAVLTPKGNLNIWCIANTPPPSAAPNAVDSDDND